MNGVAAKDFAGIYRELLAAASTRGIDPNVVTIDFTRYVEAKRNGKSIDYWDLARRRMYDHDLDRMGVA